MEKINKVNIQKYKIEQIKNFNRYKENQNTMLL